MLRTSNFQIKTQSSKLYKKIGHTNFFVYKKCTSLAMTNAVQRQAEKCKGKTVQEIKSTF